MDNISKVLAESALDRLDEDCESEDIGRVRDAIDDLSDQIDELEDKNAKLDEENDRLTEELKAAYDLIKKSGAIPDTPENQHYYNLKGIQWALLKYEK